jgi:hypothetical protein
MTTSASARNSNRITRALEARDRKRRKRQLARSFSRVGIDVEASGIPAERMLTICAVCVAADAAEIVLFDVQGPPLHFGSCEDCFEDLSAGVCPFRVPALRQQIVEGLQAVAEILEDQREEREELTRKRGQAGTQEGSPAA